MYPPFARIRAVRLNAEARVLVASVLFQDRSKVEGAISNNLFWLYGVDLVGVGSRGDEIKGGEGTSAWKSRATKRLAFSSVGMQRPMVKSMQSFLP